MGQAGWMDECGIGKQKKEQSETESSIRVTTFIYTTEPKAQRENAIIYLRHTFILLLVNLDIQHIRSHSTVLCIHCCVGALSGM